MIIFSYSAFELEPGDYCNLWKDIFLTLYVLVLGVGDMFAFVFCFFFFKILTKFKHFKLKHIQNW